MHVYLSTLSVTNVFAKWSSAFRKDRDEGLPHLVWKNITYGNYKDHRVANFDVKFPEVSMCLFLCGFNECYEIVCTEEWLTVGRCLPR